MKLLRGRVRLRKTLGLMRDIKDAKTYGIISEDAATGITEIARPIGVVGAVVPSTNPAATPANNIINALKGGNAIVLSPSPKGVPACETLIRYIYDEFDKFGLDHDLVQMVPAPGSKAKTQRMLETTDLVVVTGSQDNVRRAYTCGTPAIGVGAGNVTVIVDETADLDAAAEKIAASKTFDNATSCSSENALVVVDAIADVMIRELDLDVPAKTRFVAVETDGIGPKSPLSGEKLSRVVALYRAQDFDSAAATTARILGHQGAGHSIGLHSTNEERAIALGRAIPTCRVIVNQAHCFATGGAFEEIFSDYWDAAGK